MASIEPGLIALIIMIPLLLDLAAIVVVTCCVRDKIDVLLSDCSVVVDHKLTFGGLGIMGDIVRVGVVGTIFMFPKLYLRRGFIDLSQVTAFPKKLRYLIVIPWVVAVVVAMALMLFRLWGYIYDIKPGS
ncbi:hypothetical protein [Pseudomonas sp. W5-36]|jgi:hypothetical protein|uniref:hypothetical protein n=1 Tax=Pseudomonas sp. W5-36 TaxID=3097455 RepID=UPI00397D0A4D